MNQISINLNSVDCRLDRSRPCTNLTLEQQLVLVREAAAQALAAGDGARAAELKAKELEMRAAHLGLVTNW